jgi:hypothetical protein
MKTVISLLGALSLISSIAMAGPGISSGDEPDKVNYTCQIEGFQDSHLILEFKDVYSKNPTVSVNLPTGEYTSKIGLGYCSAPENVDEFYLNCAVPFGFEIYKVVLSSRGDPKLHGSVVKMESHDSPIHLPCKQTAGNTH